MMVRSTCSEVFCILDEDGSISRNVGNDSPHGTIPGTFVEVQLPKTKGRFFPLPSVGAYVI